MVAILATICAALAALLHVYIFVMESVQWTVPRVWKTFGLASQEDAEKTRSMAYNQGFYNLFLAIGAALGVILFWVGGPGSVAEVAGRTLALFSLGSMAAAALVLITTGRRYLRPALIQGTLPLIGFVLFIFA
jgi:putative membrane protein